MSELLHIVIISAGNIIGSCDLVIDVSCNHSNDDVD